MRYGAVRAEGAKGAFLDYRQEVIDADLELVKFNFINCLTTVH